MKKLYEYDSEAGWIELHRSIDGMYYIGVNNHFMVLPPAKADELRMALLAGYRPKEELNDMAAKQEPPHPDD